MGVFKTNFVLGMLAGVALAIAAPLAGAEVFATFAVPANATTGKPVSSAVEGQVVNRAAKSDRLRPVHNAISSEPAKSPTIPEGCDPAFSPLSRGAASNFTSRCLS